MGLFSWFTTSEKAVDTGIDLVQKAANGLDVAWLTKEEKVQYMAGIMDQAIEFNRVTHDENTEKSKTRRNLARIIIWNYLAVIDFGIFWFVFKDVTQGKNIITLSTSAFATMVICVVVFYFGYYGGVALMNANKKKK